MDPQISQKESTTPPLMPMPFTGHQDTPLTSHMYPPSMPTGMPPFDASMMFDFAQMNQMWAMGFFPPPTCPLNWATPSTSSQADPSTPKSNDSGISLGSYTSTDDNNGVFSSKIQGRLNLVNNLRHFTVTADEIQRRLNEPESMNSSTLSALLRRAKTKNGGAQMRKDLEQFGIPLPNNRGKGLPHTTFSALLEEEAELMAGELHQLAGAYFPTSALCQSMVSNAALSCSPEKMEQLNRDAFHAARFLKEVLEISNRITVPTCGRKAPPAQDPLTASMRMFSSLTHGFGVVNHKTWLTVFAELAKQVAATTSTPPQQQQQ